MEKLIGLLHPVVKDNSDSNLFGFFLDPMAGIALAGFRRIYGTGDCLFRVRMPEVEMVGDLKRAPGLFSYDVNGYDYNVAGLPGKFLPDGNREIVGIEEADQKFQSAFSKVDGHFNVALNPKKICKWIEDRTQHSGLEDRKVNMQVFAGVSADGQFPGKMRMLEQGVPTIEIRTKDGIIPGFIDETTSKIKPYHLIEGEMYIVQKVGVVEGRHLVRVLRKFKRGVRLAIQYFKNGLLLPGQARYSVYEDEQTGISSFDILDLPFIDGQDTRHLVQAPYMHFCLSTLYRALKPMEMHSIVEMRFKDSISPVLLTAVAEPGQIQMDAIIGPTSPYTSGKVCMA